MANAAIGVADIGASGGRVSALILDRDGFRLETRHTFTHVRHNIYAAGRDGETRRCLYWNPLTVYEGICEGLRRIAADDALELHAAGIDGWGTDGCWISEAGDPLFPAVSAYDPRYERARIELESVLSGRERFNLTGTYPDTFLTANHLYYYRRFQPRLVAEADVFMPLPSLYHYWLCGERAVEYTWATTGHLASCLTRAYCPEVFAAVGLPVEKVPPLTETGGVLGMCGGRRAEDLGARPFKVMIPPNHDTACAFAAAPIGPGRPTMVISAGTWWCMGALLDRPLVTDAVFDAGFSNVGGLGGTVLNIINMGSLPAQALKRDWERRDGRPMSWEDFNRIAAEGLRPGLSFDIDDPRLPMATDMQQTVFAVAGIDPATKGGVRPTAAALVYQGLADKAARLADSLGKVVGRKMEEILVVGGGARNSLLNQRLADVSGLPVRTGPADATTLGNALAQACALGWFSSLAEGREALGSLWEEKVFEPTAW